MNDLFPETLPPTWAETPKAEKLSPDRARTLRANNRIERGFHPFGLKLREPRGETCGSCKHLQEKFLSKVYWKCAIGPDTNGPNSDTRRKWPACERWVEEGGTKP